MNIEVSQPEHFLEPIGFLISLTTIFSTILGGSVIGKSGSIGLSIIISSNGTGSDLVLWAILHLSQNFLLFNELRLPLNENNSPQSLHFFSQSKESKDTEII